VERCDREFEMGLEGIEYVLFEESALVDMVF